MSQELLENKKQCPYCAELIQEAAVVCRFCNRSLTTPKKSSKSVSWIVASVILVGLIFAMLALPMRGFLGVLAIVLYFIPSVAAEVQRKRNRNAILLLNLLLGWTVIGWFVALIWAVTVDRNIEPEPRVE